jgi:hypothetical protein
VNIQAPCCSSVSPRSDNAADIRIFISLTISETILINHIVVPERISLQKFGVCDGNLCLIPNHITQRNVKLSPAANRCSPLQLLDTNQVPCVSIKATGLLCFVAKFFYGIYPYLCSSWVPCEKFSRATSIPAI